jgi:hypothetical protein
MMEAVSTCDTSINLYQTTRRDITEDTCLHARRRENVRYQLKSYNSNNLVEDLTEAKETLEGIIVLQPRSE